MSVFGDPLPHESDTATSLIRREGFPPMGTYDQMPEVYMCPCCVAISPGKDQDRLMRTAKEEKELERRRLLQLDVFEERAKPPSSVSYPRQPAQSRNSMLDDDQESKPTVPPPPPTINDLRKGHGDVDKTRLIVTVHHGKNINVDPRDPISVLVRCGAFEGQTAKVPRGKGPLSSWEELFEFPYPNEEEPLEILVIDDALPEDQDHLFGGIVVPPHALRNRQRGDEESLPVCPENEMHRSYGRMKETPMGAVVVSWYVKRGDDATDDDKMRQNLDGPVDCDFVVHRVFQYTDNGSEPSTVGVLCVLRDTDDNCSDSVLHVPGSECTTSISPYYAKEGFEYLPENPAQLMQLITTKKIGHVLICVPKEENSNEDGEELLVVGAVPLDFEKLYRKGSAVLLVESKAREDVLWGEIALEWNLAPHAERQKIIEETRPNQMKTIEDYSASGAATGENGTDGLSESLFVTVVRGINLCNRDGDPVKTAQVSVCAGDVEGSTFVAANEPEDENTNVVHWNQEVRFIELDGSTPAIDVHVVQDEQTVSSGRFEIQDNEATVVVKVHDPYNEEKELGEIVVAYRRMRSGETEGSKNEDEHTNEIKGKENAMRDGYGNSYENGEEYHNGHEYAEDSNVENGYKTRSEGEEDDDHLHRESAENAHGKDNTDHEGEEHEPREIHNYTDHMDDDTEPLPSNRAPVEERRESDNRHSDTVSKREQPHRDDDDDYKGYSNEDSEKPRKRSDDDDDYKGYSNEDSEKPRKRSDDDDDYKGYSNENSEKPRKRSDDDDDYKGYSNEDSEKPRKRSDDDYKGYSNEDSEKPRKRSDDDDDDYKGYSNEDSEKPRKRSDDDDDDYQKSSVVSDQNEPRSKAQEGEKRPGVHYAEDEPYDVSDKDSRAGGRQKSGESGEECSQKGVRQSAPGMPPTPTKRRTAQGSATHQEDSRRQMAAVPKIPEGKSPWYPSGSANNEDHVPLAKRESFRQRTDSIRELERRSRESGRSSTRRSSVHAAGGGETTPRE